MRVLVITGEAYPGHEERNLPIARELIKRGHEVRHTGPTHTMAEQGFTPTTFNPDFARKPEAESCHTRLFSSWPELYRLIVWAEVVLFSTAKGYGRTASRARSFGKIIIQQQDVGGLDNWNYSPALMAVRSSWERTREMALHDITPKLIHITGCVQFDAAAPQHGRLTRKQFCQKYGLDENKKIAVYLPTSPATHTSFLKETYRQICLTVLDDPGFDLIIKPHPRDYARNKQSTRYEDTETPTWRQLVPEAPACEAADKYDCFRHCDVLISVVTTTFLEAALFHKPMLFVDRAEFFMRAYGFDESSLGDFWPRSHYSPPGRKRFDRFGSMHTDYAKLPDGDFRSRFTELISNYDSFVPTGYPEYIGTDCSLAELPDVLSSEGYRFDDEAAYADYVATYCFANDGLAYQRVADLVELVQQDPVLSRKLDRARRRRLWYLGKHGGLRAHQTLVSIYGRIRRRVVRVLRRRDE